MNRTRLLPIYCRLAGSVDLSTGVLLLTAPAWTLGLMGVAHPPADPVWVRWVGVFVGAVGLLYWLPEIRRAARAPSRFDRRLAALESTAVVRLAVAGFVGWALLGGRLETAYVSVLLTDLGLGVFQLAWLRRLAPGIAP